MSNPLDIIAAQSAVYMTRVRELEARVSPLRARVRSLEAEALGGPDWDFWSMLERLAEDRRARAAPPTPDGPERSESPLGAAVRHNLALSAEADILLSQVTRLDGRVHFLLDLQRDRRWPPHDLLGEAGE